MARVSAIVMLLFALGCRSVPPTREPWWQPGMPDYDTPAAPARSFVGTYACCFEGSLFYEPSTGEMFETTGVDGPLVRALEKRYGSGTPLDHCGDAEIVASIADFPPQVSGGNRWLLIREVREIRPLPNDCNCRRALMSFGRSDRC